MTPNFIPVLNAITGFFIGYMSCALLHFYLECRIDWRKDDERNRKAVQSNDE